MFKAEQLVIKNYDIQGHNVWQSSVIHNTTVYSTCVEAPSLNSA